jgi:hypothetical protein
LVRGHTTYLYCSDFWTKIKWVMAIYPQIYTQFTEDIGGGRVCTPSCAGIGDGKKKPIIEVCREKMKK